MNRKPLRRPAGLSLLPLLAAALLLCAGCRDDARSESPETAPGGGSTLAIGTTSDLGGFNELISPATTTNGWIHRQLFLLLLEEQPDFAEHPPTFAPALATSYEWSADHQTLTFHLRDGVVWSDGQPVTAEDVRWTWQAQTHPDVAWEGAYQKQRIRDVEVVDRLTVRFHFTEVYATQLLDANEGYILPKHAWGKLPFSQWRQDADFFRRNLVTDGPFIVASARPQEEIVLRRNPRYHRPGLPRLDRVVFRIIPDPSSQVTQLLSGTLDFLPQVPAAEIDRIERSDRARLQAYWGRRYVFVSWNTRRAPFTDPEVRRALTMALDRQSMIETLWGDYAKPSTSPIVSTVWAHDRSLKPLPYAPQEARRILARKGWRDSDGDGLLDQGGRRFSFELLVNKGNTEREAAAVMIQEQLRRAGIEAVPRVAEFNSLVDQLTNQRYDAVIMAWGMPTTLDLEYAFHSRSIGAGSNYSAYSNPEVDRLIDQAHDAPDFDAALPFLHRLQQIIHRDQPFSFLWESQELTAVGARVEGAQSNTLSPVWHLEEWSVRPGA